MKNYLALMENPLFSGINEDEIKKLCECLKVRERRIKKGSFVFRTGDRVSKVYLILSGSMHIVDEDFWGNRTIIEGLSAHTLFGEAYALSEAKRYLVGVIAAENSVILQVDPVKLYKTCLNACPCHSIVIKNTLYILSEKLVRLTGKLEHIVKRSIREKILSYLSTCAKKAGTASFCIPYSRQQLADYLCVERSALSHELSKLKDLGMIKYRKNYFELLEM